MTEQESPFGPGTETNPNAEVWTQQLGDPASGNTYGVDTLASGSGVTTVDSGTITATGGASPAANTTIQGVSTTQTQDYIFTLFVDADPPFNSPYAFNYDYYHAWDDTNGEIDITVTVNWNTDPGSSNDVTLRYEVLSP